MECNLVLSTVTESDCKDLWLWRNNPNVRKNFFNAGPISWQEHKKWFYARIKDSNTKIYVVRQGRNKIGTIRFEIEDNRVKVSVNLNPEFFGKGLGSKVIKLGTEGFLKEIKIEKQVTATIKKDNIASQKAFEKAGYFVVKEKQDIVVLSYYRNLF